MNTDIYKEKENYMNFPKLFDTSKQLVILIAYVNVGNVTEEKVRELRALMQRQLDFSDVEKQTNLLIKTFIFPVRNQETKVECIYPKNQDNIDLSYIENKFKENFENEDDEDNCRL